MQMMKAQRVLYDKLPSDLARGSPFTGLEWLLVGDEGSMKWAFGTHTLLLHGRDEGISDPRTWKVYCKNPTLPVAPTFGKKSCRKFFQAHHVHNEMHILSTSFSEPGSRIFSFISRTVTNDGRRRTGHSAKQY